MLADIYLWVTVSAEFALMLLGAIVALYSEWAARHRAPIVVAFFVFGIAAMITTIKTAQESKASSVGLSTGGDTFCYFDILGEQIPLSSAYLRKNGEYRLYDLKMKLQVLVPAPGGAPGQSIGKGQVRLELGNIAGSTGATFQEISLLPFNLQGESSVDFVVAFNARNGVWHQLAYMRRIGGLGVGGRWLKATRVFRIKYSSEPYGQAKMTKIFEKIDDNFPMEGIDWHDWLLYDR